MNFLKRHFAILIFFAVFSAFFYPTLVKGLLPIPADTIIGLYHPFRDLYAKSNPNGIAFKNFLITDPVRQTYIWKELTVNIWQKGNIPLWNPYEMAGKPLLANFQSGVFYPLNLLLFLKPFYLSWTLFIMLQSFLSGVFLFWYLRNLSISQKSSVLGAIAFSFSGFSVSWFEWGTILQTALWLPLVLLSIDKLLNAKKATAWYILFVCSLLFSFFAGHLQTFFYLYILSTGYFVMRWFWGKRKNEKLFGYIILNLGFIVLTLPQLYPTLQFLSLSARDIDQNFMFKEGWFVPWKHLIQFLAPDFFGNPSTLNYWGTWNYAEMVGYIGIIPLLFSMFSFGRKNATIIFFWSVICMALLFSLPTGISQIPYLLKIPLLSTAQPTRLLFLVCFSLSILAAFGFDYIQDIKKIKIRYATPIILLVMSFASLGTIAISKTPLIFSDLKYVGISINNLKLPFFLLVLSIVLIIALFISKKKIFREVILVCIIILTSFDLLRFANKFTPFTPAIYLYPQTRIIDFLQNQKGVFRVSSLDSRIMPPNFLTHYKLQTIEGYDPLYLKNYAEYIAVLERNNPDIKPPFGFNRIITPHNFDSQLFDFLNTKYVLSLDEIKSPKLIKMFEEGQTKVYKNKDFFERAYFVKNVKDTENVIDSLFSEDLQTTALISEDNLKKFENLTVGNVKIINYTENEVLLETKNNGDGFLVMSDAYYPTWKVFIDGKVGRIYKTNHAFRGVYIPKGNHFIVFKNYII